MWARCSRRKQYRDREEKADNRRNGQTIFLPYPDNSEKDGGSWKLKRLVVRLDPKNYRGLA